MARLFLLLFVCATALGADEGPCADPKHHQFDFWLGDWSVYGKDGRLLGSNEIHQIAGGCGIQENWSSAATKSRGTSVNYYDNTTDMWYQTWVDNSGGSLRLEGRFDGNSMILLGTSLRGDKLVTDRITWTPVPSGDVRQHWESKSDGESGWQTTFDGMYKKTNDL